MRLQDEPEPKPKCTKPTLEAKPKTNVSEKPTRCDSSRDQSPTAVQGQYQDSASIDDNENKDAQVTTTTTTGVASTGGRGSPVPTPVLGLPDFPAWDCSVFLAVGADYA
ncbi:hypothetical protein DSL72_000689 [Monilinia vaccinii-corymbosi]|uniref:Uncharacterized protein n=1 Tax=Monilinia vaccinii-corymbosi TaxID=61207 RepID=A0A8A3P6B0_9HELO|nr:hypothetical protein DSL72_000689 [Monilinia vaccinii-corymbosi]